jgi:hypothetical protein
LAYKFGCYDKICNIFNKVGINRIFLYQPIVTKEFGIVTVTQQDKHIAILEAYRNIDPPKSNILTGWTIQASTNAKRIKLILIQVLISTVYIF